MKFSRLHRRSLAALAVVLTVAALVPAQPASATPVIGSSLAPQSGPTAGGNAVRIYGSGFDGTTSVEFGGVNATDFHVIDDTLITAVVPAASGGGAAENTFVDVKVTTGSGNVTEADAFYYTDATFTVSPSTGLDPGESITTTLDDYLPDTKFVLPQFNPLLVYIENFPAFDPPVPPPYADILVFESTTDVNGDKTVNTNLGNPFDGGNDAYPDDYDDNIACPVNQGTVDFLGNSASLSLHQPAYSGKCMVANGQYGTGTLERAINMTNDPNPAWNSLVFDDNDGVDVNQSVGVTGLYWNANPFFGSSKDADNPGETVVTVELCNYHPTEVCTDANWTATVAPTRYIYNDALGVEDFEFSGATLDASITVGSDIPRPCPETCFVRVKQYKPGGHIVRNKPIVIN